MAAAQQPTTTLFLANLDSRVTREMLYEIGIQAGLLTTVNLPTDPSTARHKGFGFLDYETVESASYAVQLFTGNLTLFGRKVHIAYSPRGRTD